MHIQWSRILCSHVLLQIPESRCMMNFGMLFQRFQPVKRLWVVRALHWRRLVGILGAVLLMSFHVFLFLTFLSAARKLTLQLPLHMLLFMLIEPAYWWKSLVAGLTPVSNRCHWVMSCLMQLQHIVITEELFTHRASEWSGGHVLGPYVCSEPLCVVALFVTNVTFLLLGHNCLQDVQILGVLHFMTQVNTHPFIHSTSTSCCDWTFLITSSGTIIGALALSCGFSAGKGISGHFLPGWNPDRSSLEYSWESSLLRTNLGLFSRGWHSNAWV